MHNYCIKVYITTACLYNLYLNKRCTVHVLKYYNNSFYYFIVYSLTLFSFIYPYSWIIPPEKKLDRYIC